MKKEWLFVLNVETLSSQSSKAMKKQALKNVITPGEKKNMNIMGQPTTLNMSYKEIKTLKGKVEYCLRKYPETRNSDTKLTIKIWKEFYGEYINESPDSRFGYLNLDNLGELPNYAGIKRIRAKFQNDQEKYLPTSWEVAKQRQFEEDEWRVAMGYPPKGTVDTRGPSWTPEGEDPKQKQFILR